MPQHPDDQLIELRRRQTRTCKHLAIAAGLALTVGSSITPPQAIAAEPNQQAAPAPATSEVRNLKTVSEYDKQIADLGDPKEVASQIANGTLSDDGELLLMRRWLVNTIKYDKLVTWAQTSEENTRYLSWLLNDHQMLELYVTGGVPGGRGGGGNASHVKSLTTLVNLAKAYKSDINDANEQNRLVYRKMMVSAALGMCDNTRLWTGSNVKADPVTRYGHIKTLRAHSEQYHFKKEIFDALPVEMMRWVFENRIADEEIPWLANYSNWFVGHDDKKRVVYKNGKPTDTLMTEAEKESERLNAYTFTEYSWFVPGGEKTYDDPVFYGEQLNADAISIEDHRSSYERQHYPAGQKIPEGWAGKYRFDYQDPNFPGMKLESPKDSSLKHTQLWNVFEKGGVCGAIAKTAENLSGVSGLPATVCGQPGHAACPRYEPIRVQLPNGKTDTRLGYTIQNDIYGWLTTNTPEVNHMLLGWEEVHTQKDESTKRYGGGPFILLATDALVDWDDFVKSFQLRVLADASASTENKLAVIDKAIEVQPFNLDATLAKVNLLEKKQATKEEWIKLANNVAKNYAYYPLPMHSFMKLIEQKGGQDVLGEVEGLRIGALQTAMQATADNVNQPDACIAVARALLGKADSKIVLFSFDDTNKKDDKNDAGVLKLGPQFSNSSLKWQYSLDGGTKWTDVADNKHEVTLSPDEIAAITAQNDIKVKLYGVQTVHTIDITEGVAPKGYSINDPERCVYLADGKSYDSVEVHYDGAWHSLERGKPLPEGKTLTLRSSAHGTALASKGDQTIELRSFRDVWDPADAKVVPAAQLKINDAALVYGSSGAHRAVDGYFLGDQNEMWETAVTNDKYLVIDLGKTRTLKYLDIVARGYGGAGNIFTYELSCAPEGAPTLPQAEGDKGDPKVDPKAFSMVGTFKTNYSNGQGGRPMVSRTTFDEPVTGRYIRIKATQTNRNSTAAAQEFIFYEDPNGVQPEPPAPIERTISVAVASTGSTIATLQAAPSDGTNSGTIEYALLDSDRKPTDGDWKPSPVFENLTPGATYYAYARISAADGYSAAVSEKHEFKTLDSHVLDVIVPAFDPLQAGYTKEQIKPGTLTLINAGGKPATVTVNLNSEHFEIVGADNPITIDPNGKNESITIKPKEGLPIGEYLGSLSINYEAQGAQESFGTNVRVAVKGIERTIDVKAENVTETSVDLSATLSAGADDGTMEYALVKRGAGMPQEGAWQASPHFEGLESDTAYDAYAHVSAGATHAPATSHPVTVRTLASVTPEPEPNPDPEPNPNPDPEPNPNPNPNPNPGPNPNPDPAPEPEPTPDPDPNQGNGSQPAPGTDTAPQSGSSAPLPATGDPAAIAVTATGIGGALAAAIGALRKRVKR